MTDMLRNWPLRWPFLSRVWPQLVVLCAVLLCLPSLWNGFQVDDYFHRGVFLGHPHQLREETQPLKHLFSFADEDTSRTRVMMDKGYLPWWTLETVNLSFFRPITALTHQLDYRFWPDNPMLMHLHSLFWYALLVWMVARLYRDVFSSVPLAGLAGLLFAVDHTHAMSVSWLANRNALISMCLGLLAIDLHRKMRQSGKTIYLPMACLALLLGLLANEGAIAACGYLFADALFLDERKPLKRLLCLAPYGLLVLVWRLVYSWLGYGVKGSEFYIDPLHSPLDFLGAVLQRPLVLFLGQWAGPPSDFFIFLPQSWRHLILGSGLCLFILLCIVFGSLLRQNALARFWGLGMVLSLIPISATFPNDRLLLFTGLGAFGLMAQMILWRPAHGSVLLRPVRLALIVFHLILAPLFLPLRITLLEHVLSDVNLSIENTTFRDDLSQKTVILVNAPSIFHACHFSSIQKQPGRTFPNAALSLAPVLFSGATIQRTDAYTLKVTPTDGYPWFLCRDSHHPFASGDQIPLQDMEVTILETDKKGKPLSVAFKFQTLLEDPSLVWLEYKDGVYVPFTPPRPGASVRLNASLPF